MDKTDEYRANAQECERMAAGSRNEADRSTWLQMAGHWLRLSQPYRSASDRFDDLEAVKGTRQKRSDEAH